MSTHDVCMYQSIVDKNLLIKQKIAIFNNNITNNPHTVTIQRSSMLHTQYNTYITHTAVAHAIHRRAHRACTQRSLFLNINRNDLKKVESTKFKNIVT